jgi:hypothetical protein
VGCNPKWRKRKDGSGTRIADGRGLAIIWRRKRWKGKEDEMQRKHFQRRICWND